MTSRRVLKVAEAIREVVSMAILADLKDPRVQDVTVTYVEVSGDLRHAKVHVSVMGNQTKQELSLRGLQSAAGYLQAKCARRIETRYTPRLHFLLDQGVKKSIAVSEILNRVLPRKPSPDLPEEGMSEEGMSEEGMSEEGMSDEGMSEERRPGQGEALSHPPPCEPPSEAASTHPPPDGPAAAPGAAGPAT